MKKKMDPLTKMKLIYSGELILVSIAVLVIGILELTLVIHLKDVVITIFNWVTIFGGLWIIIDFFWTLLSPKKRAKNCLFDKILVLPLGIYLLTFDLIALIGNIDKTVNYDFYRFGISAALLYIFVAYTFQGIYHWFRPLPMLIAELEKEQQEKAEDEKELGDLKEKLQALDEEKKEDDKEA